MRKSRWQILVGAIVVAFAVVAGIAGAAQCTMGSGQEGGCSLYNQTADSGRFTYRGCQAGAVSCWDCEKDCGGGDSMDCTCTGALCFCVTSGGGAIFYYI